MSSMESATTPLSLRKSTRIQIGLWIFVFLALIVYSFMMLLPVGPQPKKVKRSSDPVHTEELQSLRTSLLAQANAISERRSFCLPFNMLQLAAVRKAIPTATTRQLGVLSLLMPQQALGFGHVYSQLTPALNRDRMHWDVGTGERWWFVGSTATVSAVWCVATVQLAAQAFRVSDDAGGSTLYFVSCGMGAPGQHLFASNPHTIVPGTYAETGTDGSFVITTEVCVLRFNASTQAYTFNGKWEVPASGGSRAHTKSLVTVGVPGPGGVLFMQDGPGACAPCVAGTGMLSWSYPNIRAHILMDFGSGGLQEFQDAKCWMDRNIFCSSPPDTLHAAMVATTVQARSSKINDRSYIRAIVQLKNGTYFKCTAYNVSADLDATEGRTYYATYTCHIPGQESTFDHKTKIRLQKVAPVQYANVNISFPTTLQVRLHKTTYTIAALPFGSAPVISDVTGWAHWAGGAVITEGKPGTAFIEVRRMGKVRDITAVAIRVAGLPDDTAVVDAFMQDPLSTADWTAAVGCIVASLCLLLLYLIVQAGVLVWIVANGRA